MDGNLAIDMILRSLSPSFEPFMLNYYMNGLNKTLPEPHGMLKQTRGHVMTVHKGGKKCKRSTKAKKPEESKTPTKKKGEEKASAKAGDECHFCKELGY